MLRCPGFRPVRWLQGRQEQGFVGAIERVDSQRMADRLHMHANLVAASGLRTYIQQRIPSEALDNGIVCDGGLAMMALNGHHARSLWMRPNGQANNTFSTHALTTHQGEVGFQGLPM